MTTLTAAQRSLRSHWRLIALSLVILIGVTGAYSAWVYSAATDVEKLLDEADALDVAGIASGDDEAFASALELVEKSESAAGSLSSRLGPTRVAAASLGWVPWAGDQLRAPGLLSNRAQADLDAVRPMISAADDLFALKSLVAEGELTSAVVTEEFDRLIESLTVSAADTSREMDEVRAAAVRMDDLALIGLFDSRAKRAARLESKLLSYGELLNAAPPALAASLDVVLTAQELMDELAGGTEQLDLPSVASTVSRLSTESQVAVEAMAALDVQVQETLPGSEFETLVADLSAAMGAVADLSSGLSTITTTFNTALEILKTSSGSLLSNGGELKGALQFLVENGESLGEATDLTVAASASLNELVESGRADFLPADINDVLIEQTATLVDAGELMREAPSLVLDLIAAGTTKTYLVLGQTSDELRAAGGFTSSAWTLTFTDGTLASTEYIPILEFDNLTAAQQSPPPAPEPLRYYMDAGAMYLRDVGWSPDFPVVGKLASDLYRANQDGEVDGVLAITQWGIIRLVEALGGIEVEGEFVTPDKTLELIETRTDSDGTGFLEELFVGLLDSLRGDSSAGTQLELLRAIQDILSRKDLMFYSEIAEEQARLAAIGWAGQFPIGQRDRLGLIDSNVGWSKSDRSIERSASYHVDLSDLTRPMAVLSVSYQNTGNDTGRPCDLQSPPPSAFGSYLVSVNSCYWNYVRAYVAVGSILLQPANLPLPEHSVPDRLGAQGAGSSTFTVDFDESGDHFAGLLNVGPGAVRDFSFSYQLPAAVVERTENELIYSLRLIAQSGARGRMVTVNVQFPPGYSITQSSHPVASDEAGNVTFLIDLQTDQLLEIAAAAD